MSDYYIRIPEQDESRGPFDISKLLTLAEAGQITPNTLYYDEQKEEWIPLALNKELKAEIFPEREKLSLKIATEEKAKPVEVSDPNLNVEKMLSEAEGNTKEKKKEQRQKGSLSMAANLSCFSLALMMILSAAFLVLPFVELIQGGFNEGEGASIINYPFLIVAMLDLLLGVMLLLAVSDVFPVVRLRAMLTLGFGVYVGYSLGDQLLIGLFAAAGIGAFLATISRSLGTMILAIILGVGGHAYLAQLAMDGRFDGFFNGIVLNLFAG